MDKNLNTRLKVVVLTCLGALAVSQASAALVLNGGFEDTKVGANGGDFTYLGDGIETIGPDVTGSTVGAWNVTAGSVDLVTGYFVAPEGINSLDLSGIHRRTISQNISLSAGAYQLSFLLSGNHQADQDTKTVEVSLFGPSQTFSTVLTANGNGSWDTATVNYVLVAGLYTLQFKDVSPGDSAFGVTLHNIQLAAVPEPTTMIAGIGALGLLLFGAGVHSKRSVLRIGK